MDEPKTEPLTAAEAQAVLLALGTVLEWTEKRVNHIQKSQMLAGENGYNVYEVSVTGAAKLRRRTRRGNDVISTKLLANIAEAKLACECHHATGEWE